MGSHVALVKGNLHWGFGLTELHAFFGFGKGGRQMGSQVNKKKYIEQTERQVFLYKAYYAKF